jgi:hypothetical protein
MAGEKPKRFLSLKGYNKKKTQGLFIVYPLESVLDRRIAHLSIIGNTPHSSNRANSNNPEVRAILAEMVCIS